MQRPPWALTLTAMNRDPRPLFVLAIMGGLLLLILVTFGPLAGGRGRPTELLPEPAEASTPVPDADSAPPLHDRAWGVIFARHYLPYFNRSDVGPSGPADMEELAPLDLSGLTPARLRQLKGQRLRLRVITDSGGWRVGDRDVFEAMMKDAGDSLATV